MSKDDFQTNKRLRERYYYKGYRDAIKMIIELINNETYKYQKAPNEEAEATCLYLIKRIERKLDEMEKGK